jgi:hypothetical protein
VPSIGCLSFLVDVGRVSQPIADRSASSHIRNTSEAKPAHALRLFARLWSKHVNPNENQNGG